MLALENLVQIIHTLIPPPYFLQNNFKPSNFEYFDTKNWATENCNCDNYLVVAELRVI